MNETFHRSTAERTSNVISSCRPPANYLLRHINYSRRIRFNKTREHFDDTVRIDKIGFKQCL